MRLIIVLFAWIFATGSAFAHFHVVVPQRHSVSKGEQVAFVIKWGHPYEGQWFDCERPESVTVKTPSGKTLDLTPDLMKQNGSDDKDKSQVFYQFNLTPEERGDYLVVVRTPPVWLEEDEIFLQDIVSVVLHVQAQKGWDTSSDAYFAWAPLTRPYGLRPNSVFRALLRDKGSDGRVLGGALVEIERLNAFPPKELPADEFITLMAKTDPQGIVVATLPEIGWWSLTASKQNVLQKTHEGKKYPVHLRTTFWVYVNSPMNR